jgi:hypothetical protein
MGRLFALLLGVSGTFVISLVILVLQRKLTFDTKEDNAYYMMKLFERQDKMKRSAANVIKQAF